ncbi:hypothetical protein MPSEU_000564800 [Mayamaea pseudoterrestris]|nr:hypothetical protein MPSEU_000564800 [Mayamaea pseudoterrestris]
MRAFLSLEVGLSDAADFETLDELRRSDSVCLARVGNLRLSVTRQSSSSNDQSTLVGAVFVPRKLMQRTLDRIATSCAGNVLSQQIVDWNEAANKSSKSAMTFPLAEPSGYSSKFLAFAHPELGKEQVLCFLSFDSDQHSPADVVLFDLSKASPQRIHDILDATNGKAIHDDASVQNNLLLKVLVLSNVYFCKQQQKRPDAPKGFDVPICPICIHRIEPARIGLPKPKNVDVCSKFCPTPHIINDGKTFNDNICLKQQLLRPWPAPSKCACCSNIGSYWSHTPADRETETASGRIAELADMFCYKCPMQETLWVCLTCGFIGCGRYSNKHAAEHFIETNHPYSLELATLRIWDYVESEYAHRTDLLECPSSPPLLHPFRSLAALSAARPSRRLNGDDGYASTDPFGNFSALRSSAFYASAIEEKTPKKTSMIGEEYETMLQSALDDQAQHFEAEITRLRAQLTAERVDASQMTENERRVITDLQRDISLLRSNIDSAARNVVLAQSQEARQRATSHKLVREQQVVQDLIVRIKEEMAVELNIGRRRTDEMESQIADLTANQRMRHQFSQNDELLNAQLFGTPTVDPEAKESFKKLGKKSRRLLKR